MDIRLRWLALLCIIGVWIGISIYHRDASEITPEQYIEVSHMPIELKPCISRALSDGLVALRAAVHRLVLFPVTDGATLP